MTDGLDVLVQLVIAAITTEPCCNWQSTSSTLRSTCVRRGGAATAVPPPNGCPPSASQWLRTSVGGAIGDVGLTSEGSASRKARGTAPRATRSCGRRGPARLGSTEIGRASCRERVWISGDGGSFKQKTAYEIST